MPTAPQQTGPGKTDRRGDATRRNPPRQAAPAHASLHVHSAMRTTLRALAGSLRRTPTLRRRESNVPSDEWIRRLEDGRRVKFTSEKMPEDGSFITAQIEGNEVVYSVVLNKEKNPLSRDEVETHFKSELSKK